MDSIEEFIAGMDLASFRVDDKTASAVMRKLEIIGEAVKQVPEKVRQRYSHIPWKEMGGMRDKLIHFYFGVDYSLVWRAITARVPKVKEELRAILEEAS